MKQRTPSKFERREAGGAVLSVGEDRRARFLANSAEVDRHGTVILPQGIKTDNFRKNPAFVWAHQTGGIFTACQPEDLLGRVAEWEVTGKGFEIVAEFAEASVNPKAERCYRAVQADLLRAVSIGFTPLKWHVEERDGGEVLIFDEVDLLEVSLCILGSNPEALALRSLFTEKTDMTKQLARQKLGTAEGAKAADIRTALVTYLAGTDDDKPTRAAVTRAADEMAREAEGHEEPDGDEGESEERAEGDGEGEDKDKPKESEDEERAEGDKDDDEDGDEEKRALRQALAWTREGLAEARQSGKGAAAKERRVVEEVDAFIRAGRVPRHQRDKAIEMHRRGRLERTVKHIEAGTFTTSQRLRSGNVGTPVDAPPRREDRTSRDPKVRDDAKNIMNQARAALGASTRGLA